MSVNQNDTSLPIFEVQERRLLISSEMQLSSAVQDGEDRFLRPVYTSGPINSDLESRLESAQNEFRLLSCQTQTEIVPHRFGLYPADKVLENYYRAHGQNGLIPSGYILAAEVKIIPHEDSRMLKLRPHSIRQGIKLYRQTSNKLANLSARQFIQNSETGAWTYLGIEPRLRG